MQRPVTWLSTSFGKLSSPSHRQLQCVSKNAPTLKQYSSKL